MSRIPICHPDRRHYARELCKRCYDKEYRDRNKSQFNVASGPFPCKVFPYHVDKRGRIRSAKVLAVEMGK